MTNRPGWAPRGRQAAWALPGALGTAVTIYLAWGAWVSAHDPGWPYASPVWWRVWLRPDHELALLGMATLWCAALACYWLPRRAQPQTVGLTTVVTMVLIGAVLGLGALIPCRGGETRAAPVGWLLGLYVGNPPPVYPSQACPGRPPLALQLAGVVCLGATLVGALAAAAVLWREPVGRLRARLVKDAVIFTGLDSMTLPLLRELTRTGRPASVVVIEPESGHPLLEDARATGARVMIGQPTSPRVLQPVIAGRRGCALRQLYALRGDARENEAVLAAAQGILGRYQPDPERQAHLVARIDDPRHADHWRGWHIGTSQLWFEDALSAYESTARTIAGQIFRTGAERLLLCGDSTLALAILREIARCAWEHQQLAQATSPGHISRLNGRGLNQADRRLVTPPPLHRIVLLDERAEDLHREFLATSPPRIAEALPEVSTEQRAWERRLLALMDALPPAQAAAAAVVVADPLTESGMHEAGRVARLHPRTPVFVLTSDGAGTTGAIYDSLRPIERALLVDGQVPEDAWTRVARHWHECFRLGHPPALGEPRSLTSRPWAELNDFIRQDNILQVRSIMAAVASLGRRWAPSRAVVPGSFIELSARELEEVACTEHTRWYTRRVAAGWSAGSHPEDTGPAVTARPLVNRRVVPWTALLPEYREAGVRQLKSQLEQLEDVGFMPIVPQGGPEEATKFQRVGIVRARRLDVHWPWIRRHGEHLIGEAGDWQVRDKAGDERTVRDAEFRKTHERLDGDRWRRRGTLRAWRVTEKVTLRTIEGRTHAYPGDWVVEGLSGERWPVPHEQFRRTYRAVQDGQRG